MDGRYNPARATLLEIQHLADHAQLVLQSGDEKAARADIREITKRLALFPSLFPATPDATKNGPSQHLLQTSSSPSSSSPSSVA